MAVRTHTSRESDDIYVAVGDVGKLRGREVVVFDLDGVLIDSRDRYRLSLAEVDPDAETHEELSEDKKRQFWRVFLSEKYMDHDKPIPNAIEMLRERKDYFPIVIITGRTSNMLNKTIEQLKKFGIEYDALILRNEGIFLKDWKFKKHVVEKLGLKVVEVHDDSAEVINKLLPHLKNVAFWWYETGKYVLKHPTLYKSSGGVI